MPDPQSPPQPQPQPHPALHDLAPLVEMTLAAEARLRPFVLASLTHFDQLPGYNAALQAFSRLVSIRKTLIRLDLERVERIDRASLSAGKSTATQSTPQSEIAAAAAQLVETNQIIDSLADSPNATNERTAPQQHANSESSSSSSATAPRNSETAINAIQEIRACAAVSPGKLAATLARADSSIDQLGQSPLPSANHPANNAPPQPTPPQPTAPPSSNSLPAPPPPIAKASSPAAPHGAPIPPPRTLVNST